MRKYVVFVNPANGQPKVYTQDCVTRTLVKDLKRQGYRKHNIVVAANTKQQAIDKIRDFDADYSTGLSEFTGSLLFYCLVMIIIMVASYHMAQRYF